MTGERKHVHCEGCDDHSLHKNRECPGLAPTCGHAALMEEAALACEDLAQWRLREGWKEAAKVSLGIAARLRGAPGAGKEAKHE